MIAPGVTHKSDIGGVIMGLHSPLAVAEAAVTLADRARTAGAALEGVLLQREVRAESRRWSASPPTRLSVRCSYAAWAA